MGRLDGKVALVTGVSRGIGRGIAVGLANEGAKLVLAARNVKGLKETEAKVVAQGSEALIVPTDVTSEEEIVRLFNKTMQRFGKLDILVNNAGAFDSGPIDQLSTEAWNRVVAVNLRAPFLCTRAAFLYYEETWWRTYHQYRQYLWTARAPQLCTLQQY